MADKMSKLILPVKSGNTITEKEFDVGGGGNTFVGTTAEWEALTAEQQNTYDCRVLTDDDLDTKNVIDNLTSDSSTDALSAKQGKVLKGLVDQTQGQVSDSDDAYDPTKAYAVNELCIHNDKLYRCTTPCSAGSWEVNQSCFTADTLMNAVTYLNRFFPNNSMMSLLDMATFTENIDRINKPSGYFLRVLSTIATGSFPSSITGNGFLLIGFSSIGTTGLFYGVQMAIGFGSSTLAIRNCIYSSTGTGTWSEWRYI